MPKPSSHGEVQTCSKAAPEDSDPQSSILFGCGSATARVIAAKSQQPESTKVNARAQEHHPLCPGILKNCRYLVELRVNGTIRPAGEALLKQAQSQDGKR
jgi:hypothetical protein